MTAEIINMKDLKAKSKKVEPTQEELDDIARERFSEFVHFVNGDMSEEEGTPYFQSIGWNVIFGRDATPLGLIGHTDWGWIDTYNEAVHFHVGEYIKSFPMPPLEEWPVDTVNMLEDCAEFCLHGTSTDNIVQPQPPKNTVH